LLSKEGQKAIKFHQKDLHLCSEDERLSFERHEGEQLMTEFPFFG